jgi:DNA-binding response OmpR family regulator
MSGLGTILILEDEPDLLFLLRQNLEREGFRVLPAETCRAAREALAAADADLLLLDVNLPDGNGFDLLETWRQEGRWTPTVFLTARADEADRLRGFAVGGDDYVCKPFSMAELVARVGAIIRRSRQTESAQTYRCGAFEIDYARYRLVPQGGEALTLTYLETELLRYPDGGHPRAQPAQEAGARPQPAQASAHGARGGLQIRVLSAGRNPAPATYRGPCDP